MQAVTAGNGDYLIMSSKLEGVNAFVKLSWPPPQPQGEARQRLAKMGDKDFQAFFINLTISDHV